MVNSILKDNFSKFLGKVKHALIGKIADKVASLIDERLGEDFPLEDRAQLKDIFLVDYNETELLNYDEELNYEKIVSLFVKNVEHDSL